MAEIKECYVEFFGDPSDDKECYKRYSSTEPFPPCGNDAEVIRFVNYKAYEQAVNALREMREHICDGGGERPCSQMWYQDVIDETLGEAVLRE